MNKLRIIIILGNVVFLIWLLFLAISDGFYDAEEAVPAIAMMLLLVFNIYFLAKASKEKSWLALLFERKALEEKQKIKDLQS